MESQIGPDRLASAVENCHGTSSLESPGSDGSEPLERIIDRATETGERFG
jgi:hypothetical protein